MLDKIRKTWSEFPTNFWVIVIACFVDVIGGTLIFPFFSLYITHKFQVGMTQAGALLGLFSISGLVGSMIGGALTDKFGRRRIVLFGLAFSALSGISLGLVNDLGLFYVLAIFVGLLSSVGGPARQAMVADLLPEEKRTEGFGILRVAANLGWIIGPTIGGLVASRSYLLLFILDSVMSLITAAIVFKLVPETKPQAAQGKPTESLWQTFAGYRVVARDALFMAFLAAITLMLIVYMQLYSTLSVYLRDVHGIPAQGYGLLLSLNACVVVVAQLWLSHRIKAYAPLLMMAVGTWLYLVGFTMYGLFSTYPAFVIAMLVITFGEMIVVPVEQTIAARFAPSDMRGRYMAVYGLAHAVASAIGPGAAGLIMDHFDPRWVWYGGGLLCAIAIAAFYTLYLKTQARFETTAEGQPTPAAT